MMAKLEPGWLMRTCHSASLRVMLDHDPSQYIPTKPPIPEKEAAELYTLMAARFEAWTGKSLIQYCEGRPDPLGYAKGERA